MIAQRDLDEVRSRADIVQVIGERIQLKKAGQNFKGLCPFHGEKTPSFMVHPEKQIFHCFGCGEGGDVFTFLMKNDGIEFVEAVETLAERYGVPLSRAADGKGPSLPKGEKDLLFRINRVACRYFFETLQGPNGGRGRDYLKRREIRDEMIQESYLGYAPPTGKGLLQRFQEKKVPLDLAVRLGLIRKGEAGDFYDFFRDRLMFGVVSPEGKVLGFSGRALGDGVEPKYLNSSESAVYQKSDSFLGLHLARTAIRSADQVILVEGNFDLVRLHQEGIRNVVAPLGTALTEKQVGRISRLTQNFLLIFDGDEAGLKAAGRALEIFLPLGISPKTVVLPRGEDPDSFVRTRGVQALRDLIGVAPSLLDLRIEQVLLEEGKDSQGHVRALRRISDLLKLLPGGIEKSIYVQEVAGRFGLSEESLKGFLTSKGARKTGNFLAGSGDQGGKLPPIERTILEVLLSGSVNPEALFGEIGEQDFTHEGLGEVWRLVREEHQGHGKIDLARVLGGCAEERTRKILSELAFSGSRWKEEGRQVALDCVRQIRTSRAKGRLKDLSAEIRQAERDHNTARMKELLQQKNDLMKQMFRLH